MQWDRIADPAELSGTVRGLGVTDAFLLELQAVQRPLLEQQLRAMAKAIRIRIDQLGHAEQLAYTSYELQLIRMMQTPSSSRLKALSDDWRPDVATLAPQSETNDLRILTVEQVAERVQLSAKTVMRAIQAGELEASQLTQSRGGWRVREQAIAAWLEARSNRHRGPRQPADLRPRDGVPEPRRIGNARHRTTSRARLRIDA
jgi:excisionase family DNA binding protein